MNIQIYAAKRDFGVQKAERYFKERRIPYSFVDLARRPLSPRELESVARCVGISALVKETDDWQEHYILQLKDVQAAAKELCANQKLLKTPIVRNGQKATVGFCPDVWNEWK